MKKTDFDNLRAATTARPSETEALFSNKATSSSVC